MPPFLVGTTTHKAPRRIPDTRINPDGVLLRRFERQGTEQIARALQALRRRRFAGLNADSVGRIVTRMSDREVMQPFRDVVAALIQEWALAGSDFGREQVESTIFGTSKQVTDGVAVDWALANNAAAEWAQGYSFQLVTGIEGTTRRYLQREISSFATSGETFQAFSRRIAADRMFSPRRARSISVTEVTRSYAEGNKIAWRESGVVEGMEWNTANDEIVRECPICWPLHNTQVPLDEDFESVNFRGPGPPGHPLCRCWLTPVTIGDLETGREISQRLDLPRFGG